MEGCCRCGRKWSNIKRSDKDKNEYNMIDDDMANFFCEKNLVACVKGWVVCKKCQNSYNTERTRRKRQQEKDQRMGSPDHKRTRTCIERVSKPSAPEPVAGPSWADPDVGESYAQPEDIDDTAASLSSLSLSGEPQVFSPLSFTSSPTMDHVFQFPSPHEGLDQQPSQGEDIDESDPEDEPSGDHSDPDEESDSESEDAPVFW